MADTSPGELSYSSRLILLLGAPTQLDARWLETRSWITWLCYGELLHLLTR